jgi:protein O-mannose beta-1,4-N-acetylglucosaminyltransferase
VCSWSSGVLEDQELQFQEAVAEPPSKKSDDSAAAAAGSGNGSSPSVVHSDRAILPAPVQQIPPTAQEVKALADQQISAVPEVKQAGILLIPLIFWGNFLLSLFKLQ